MTQEELTAMVQTEAERLGVGTPKFLRRHLELMEEIESIRQREQTRKEEQTRQKQVLNVRDVMEALEVSESKAYGIIKKLNQELEAQGYIVVRGKVSRVYFEEKLYGIKTSG